MKLMRYGPPGFEKPGCIDKQGRIRDLSKEIDDIRPDTLHPDNLARLAAIDIDELPIINQPIRIGTPYSGTRNFIGVGLNFSDHAAETGADIPSEPILFTKWCRPTGPNDIVVLPPSSTQSDWEVELGVVIGKTARHVSQDEALQHVAGYCIVNDVSERAYQFERGGTWDKGKGYDTFGPIGPWLVTTDEITDPQNLSMWLEVNGHRYQDGNTSTMIFDVPYLVHYISQFVTLHPGDLITTGTPPGVGLGQKPPVFLKPGDVMKLGIDGLGIQEQHVHEWDASLLPPG